MIEKLSSNNYSCFPIDIIESFLVDFGSYELFLKKLLLEDNSFLEKWQDPRIQTISEKYFRPETNLDWKWGLCFPFFDLLERYVKSLSEPIIIGFSGLPGSGKSTLGYWINNLSRELGLPIKVISLDDFYLPSSEMDKAMKGNPWNVPRGIPGSHSIDLLNNTLDSYLGTGILKSPIFDKSLRNGSGDRSGWVEFTPKVLILEGWFVGCKPLIDRTKLNNFPVNNNLVINNLESDYRNIIQDSLYEYIHVWTKFHKLWHLKSTNISNIVNWKTQQENEMLLEKGSALTGDKLSSFIRMIKTSIPYESLSSIDSDTRITINKDRKITNLSSRSY